MLFSRYAHEIKSVELDNEISVEEFVAVSRYHAKVSFSPNFIKRVNDSRALFNQLVEKNVPIYGVNTGFGDNVKIAVDKDKQVRLQENLLHSHACSVGDSMPEDQTRALLLIQLISVGHGYSAVRLEVLERIRDFLNLGIRPYVPCEGCVGCLSYAPYAAMTVFGDGRVIEDGKVVPASILQEKYGLEPLQIQAREGLGIIKGGPISTALLGLYDMIVTMRYADICAAAVCEALQSTDKSFDAQLLNLKDHTDMQASGAWMRKALAGSEIMDRARNSKVQDCISVRLIPHMAGAVKSQIVQAHKILTDEVNAVIDNPVFCPDGTALSGSNFDASYVAVYCDALCIGAINLAKMFSTHEKRLIDSKLSGLPHFLVNNSGVNSGFMMVQFVIEGLCADLAQLSNPSTAYFTITGANQEGPNALADIAARKLCTVAHKLQEVITMTMLSAFQGIDFLDAKPSPAIEKLLAAARQTVSFMEEDDVMYERIDAMHKVVESGILLDIAQNELGDFSI